MAAVKKKISDQLASESDAGRVAKHQNVTELDEGIMNELVINVVSRFNILDRPWLDNDSWKDGSIKEFLLTVESAGFDVSQYKKLRKLIDEHPDADFILWNGSRPQIKRRKFEAYIDENLSAI